MRGPLIVVAALGICLAAADPLQAGVYSLAETAPWPLPVNNFRQFRFDLGDRRSIAGSQEGEGMPRQRYLDRVAKLTAKEKAGGLTRDDRIDLSACYLYLMKPEDAARVLEAVPQDQRNFMVLCNLATAHQQAGRLDRAAFYLRQALEGRDADGKPIWPTLWPGWGRDRLNWYRRAEKFHLLLLEGRYRESLRQPNRPWDSLDPLFPNVRFVGPSGTYEAGGIGPAQWAELPADALALVVQLVLWLPNDDRLFWLLGELLNAQGDVAAAETVLSELVRGRNQTGVKELFNHRKELVQARFVLDAVEKEMTPARWELLLMAVAPRSMPAPPGIGALTQDLAWQAAAYDRDNPTPKAPAGDKQPAGPEMSVGDDKPRGGTMPADTLPNWQHIAVSFLAGGVVSLLIGLQVREYYRRRQKGTVNRA